MLGTIRRHQAWLWWVIGGITVISFVIFGPTNFNRNGSGGRNGGGSGDFGAIGGVPITREEFDNASREVALDQLLRSGQRAEDTPAFRREVYLQLFCLKKEQELGIQVSTEAAAAFGKRQVLEPLARSSGVTSFDEFVKRFLKPAGFDEGDFDRFLRHELARDQLIASTGVSGRLVTPGEAETIFRAEHQDLATALMYFSSSNYAAGIVPTPEAIQSFYSNEVANYRIPERMQVAYVKFNVTNQFAVAQAAITNLDTLANDFYLKAGTNAFSDAKTPEEAKTKIKETLVKLHAMTNETLRIAYQFANDLDAIKTNRSAETFEALAKEKKFTPETSAPFDALDGPTNMDVPRSFTATAFSLSPQGPFSGVIPAEDGYYVIAFKKSLPSEDPAFKDVEAKVKEDYRQGEAVQLARQAASKFYPSLTNGLAEKKTVSNLCAEAKVTLEPISPFSLSSTNTPPELRDRVSFGLLRQVAFSLQVGSVSPPVSSRDGAFMLYLEKKLPVDEALLKKELPGFLAIMRRGRMFDAFNQWMSGQVRQDPGFERILQQLDKDAQTRAAGGRARP